MHWVQTLSVGINVEDFLMQDKGFSFFLLLLDATQRTFAADYSFSLGQIDLAIWEAIWRTGDR